jgi:hypothetical protein
MKMQMSLRAHPRYLISADVGAFVLSLVVLFALTRVSLLLSPLAFALLSLLMAGIFGADIGLWFARGIRLVEVDGERISVCAGRSLRTRSFDHAGIKSLRVRRGIGRRSVLLKPRSGGTVRIREDAFPREDFARFVVSVRDWR